MSHREGLKRADTLPDPDDPVLYPRLSPEQIAQVEAFAECREYRAGELLYDEGERDTPLFVLESGTADIIDRRTDGDLCIARIPAGKFIGDIAMFTGEPTVVACVALEPVRALAVGRERLRELAAQHGEIGDLLLKTFMARRAWLEGHGYGQVTLIGSRSSQEAFRLREFLARNQIPFRWYEEESDPATRALLDRLGIPPGETPVLVRGGGKVCRSPEVGAVADELGLRPDPATNPMTSRSSGPGRRAWRRFMGPRRG